MAKASAPPPAKPQPRPPAQPLKKSASNALDVPGASLQTFNLADLAQYTKEGAYATTASPDFHLFYVGRDDVHDILKYVLSRLTVSLYMNMYGYDDAELNDIVFAKALDPSITVLITLDKSQSGSATEKRLLSSDIAKNPTAYNTISSSVIPLLTRSVIRKASSPMARWRVKVPRTGRPAAKEYL